MPNRVIAAAVGVAVGLGPAAVMGQEIDILMTLPAATLTFSAPFIAEDAGFYRKEGLKVSHRTIAGVGAVNAVIAGSADFTMGTGPVFLRAAAQGQRLYAIANLIDKPLVELVLRKDVADAAGLTDATPFTARAKTLRGKTIGIQGVGSIVHAWQRLVANRGGLDIEKDVSIAHIDPLSLLETVQTNAIDGCAIFLSFTTEAVVTGGRHAGSAVRDATISRRFPTGSPPPAPPPAAGSRRNPRPWRERSPAPTHSSTISPRPRSIFLGSGSRRWIPPCLPPPGRSFLPPMPRTCASRSLALSTRNRSASKQGCSNQRMRWPNSTVSSPMNSPEPPVKWAHHPNLRKRPRTPAKGRGSVQRAIKRAFAATSASALTSTQIYD
jgi:hypothetical protein